MMKKRIAALALACAMAAAIPAMSVEASIWNSTSTSGVDRSKLGSFRSNNTNNIPQYDTKKTTDYLFDLMSSVPNAKELKPSGVADVKVNVVAGSDRDNIIDNGVKPLIKEFVKASNDRLANKSGSGSKAEMDALEAVYYGNVSASQPGNVTFKIEDKIDISAYDRSGNDPYAIVLHYTGNAADEDGITSQYCKISSAGKVTAHFNTYGAFAIVVTRDPNAQRLANTYSHSVGSDAANLTPAATVAAPVATTTQAAAAPAAAQTTVAAPVSSTATPAATTQATVAAPAATTTTQAAAAPSTVSTVSTTSQTMQTSTPATITPNNGPIMVVR